METLYTAFHGSVVSRVCKGHGDKLVLHLEKMQKYVMPGMLFQLLNAQNVTDTLTKAGIK